MGQQLVDQQPHSVNGVRCCIDFSHIPRVESIVEFCMKVFAAAVYQTHSVSPDLIIMQQLSLWLSLQRRPSCGKEISSNTYDAPRPRGMMFISRG